MIRKSLGLFFIFTLPILFLVATPAFASQMKAFDPFFLLMDFDFMLIGLLLGGLMITLSYFFIRKHTRES